MSGPRPQVRYWKSRGTWIDENNEQQNGAYCCWYRGKQRILAVGPDDALHGPTYNAALKAWTELLRLDNAGSAGNYNTVRVIAELYLRHIEKKRSPQTVKMRLLCLTPFVAAFGEAKVKDIKPHEVDEWLVTMQENGRKNAGTGLQTKWTNGTARIAIASIQACLNWACKKKYLDENPLKGMEQPDARSRGREALIGNTDEERAANHQRILAECSPALRQLAIVLEATGARPGELCNATAKDFDKALGAIVYHADDKRLENEFRHKTAGKGKDRVILLSGEALDVVRRLAKKHASGKLFRTSKGKPWTRTILNNRFRVIRKRLDLPNLTPYSYRHGFATSWLKAGKSVDLLAELMGNSPAIIRKHYSHLLSDTANLRRQLEAFRAERNGS